MDAELDARAPDTEEAPVVLDAGFESTFEVAVAGFAAGVAGAARAAIPAGLEGTEVAVTGGGRFGAPMIGVVDATAAGSRVGVSMLVVVGIVA